MTTFIWLTVFEAHNEPYDIHHHELLPSPFFGPLLSLRLCLYALFRIMNMHRHSFYPTPCLILPL